MDKQQILSYFPEGHYLLTRDWVELVESGHGTQKLYLECYPEHVIYRQEPKSLEKDIHWKFRIEIEHKSPAAFVAFLPGGRIWGANGVVISPDNKLLADVSIEFNKKPEQHSIFLEKNMHLPDFTTNQVAVLASVAGWNYYHWMFDILPRIHLLQKSGISVDQYAINSIDKPFQRETLHKLGILGEKMILLNNQTHLLSTRLVVPSLPGHSGYMPKWVCDFLREEFLCSEEPAVEEYERIYISRMKAGYRKVINEYEVIPALEELGFKSVILEDLPLVDQVHLFASAEIIVAPHGAGLTNLVFCKPGTKVIEIFSPNYVNVCYWALSNQMELDYYYLLGAGKQPPEYVDPHIVVGNLCIDITSLRNLIRLAEGCK